MVSSDGSEALLSPERFLGLGFQFAQSKVFLTAVELEVFTHFAKDGPMDVNTLRNKIGLHERGARDFLDCLVSLKVLERDQEGKYSNIAEGNAFLDKNKPGYVGGLLHMMNDRLYGVWGNLGDALRTGQRQTSNGGDAEQDPFKDLYANEELLRAFLSAMTGVSMGVAMAVTHKFDWSKYTTFVDIGCAQGCLSSQLALAHPHIRGTGFDLPAVGHVFEEYISNFGLSERVKFEAGDFFKDEKLPSADVITMGHILHDWDMDTKKMLLKKAYEALPKGGVLIVYEALIDNERRTNTYGLVMSLNMLLETPGGFDYTGADCEQWMRETGFTDTYVQHLMGPHSMVVATK